MKCLVIALLGKYSSTPVVKTYAIKGVFGVWYCIALVCRPSIS